MVLHNTKACMLAEHTAATRTLLNICVVLVVCVSVCGIKSLKVSLMVAGRLPLQHHTSTEVIWFIWALMDWMLLRIFFWWPTSVTPTLKMSLKINHVSVCHHTHTVYCNSRLNYWIHSNVYPLLCHSGYLHAALTEDRQICRLYFILYFIFDYTYFLLHTRSINKHCIRFWNKM